MAVRPTTLPLDERMVLNLDLHSMKLRNQRLEERLKKAEQRVEELQKKDSFLCSIVLLMNAKVVCSRFDQKKPKSHPIFFDVFLL